MFVLYVLLGETLRPADSRTATPVTSSHLSLESTETVFVSLGDSKWEMTIRPIAESGAESVWWVSAKTEIETESIMEWIYYEVIDLARHSGILYRQASTDKQSTMIF